MSNGWWTRIPTSRKNPGMDLIKLLGALFSSNNKEITVWKRAATKSATQEALKERSTWYIQEIEITTKGQYD